jgi:[protein-PII] uridylyltransferase
MPALLAVGGYGRAELNPHSDIDIMFLCRDERERERAPDMLYALWDAGLDIGYSVRTVPECAELGKKDIKIRTSLLESRLIAGGAGLFDSFLRTMKSEVFYWRASQFVSEKLAERAATRQKYGGSLYLREPNIKESAGGLRDFHTTLWIAFTHFRISSFGDLVNLGVITEGQYAVFLRSRNFVWRLRNELHYLSGRKSDQLSFDVQEAAARDFRYRNSAHLLAVERFMKAYFLHARNIQEFSRIVAESMFPKPKQRWYERAQKAGPFTLAGRVLVPSSADSLRSDPSAVLRAFELMQSRRAIFSDALKKQIRDLRVTDAERTAPEAARIFLGMLNNPDGLSETLTVMKDLKFLGRYLPEFRSIQALARHDYYHTYTVDEHILTAIRCLEDVWQGRYPALATLFDALRGLKRRWVLFLALLLHDLGKAYRSDHERKGVEIAGRVLDRLGVGAPERERVLFLIGGHLAMSMLSQRRELTDSNMIAGFARLVKDRENLDMLFLLTYADMAAVSPTAWTQWKATLLQELYLRTRKYFEEAATIEDHERRRLAAASDRLRRDGAALFSAGEIEAYLAAMPEKYLVYTPVRKMLDHVAMVNQLPRKQLVIEHQHYPRKGYTELTVCAYDAYGIFYRTAGVIASQNLNILRAQIYTGKTGVMIDMFQITDADGTIATYEEVWKSVTALLRDVLAGGRKPPEPRLTGYQKARPGGPIAPSVEFDNETADALTIIDITARDRVGLLYRIAKTLYDLNLDVASAKIVTEGIKAMDSFYVSDLLRKKITDPERLGKIKEALLAALE